MRNWYNNSTYETVSITVQNNRTQDTVYPYEDYEPRSALI